MSKKPQRLARNFSGFDLLALHYVSEAQKIGLSTPWRVYARVGEKMLVPTTTSKNNS